LKKVIKSSSCNVLTVYERKFPTNLWDDFYRYNYSKLYKRLKKQIFQEQGGICAYCESKVEEPHKQRIEHFNDKSNSTRLKNLHLDWNNLIGVCLGGSNIRNKENPLFRTPANLSCDAFKDNHANILNPLDMLSFPNLFELDKRTCELKANIPNCQLLSFLDNPYSTTEDFVTNTIRDLNLNCDRLTTDRHKILIEYNKEIEKGRRINDRNVFKKLAEKWFSYRFPNLFTTRRILLGNHAEKFLKDNNYNG